MKMNIVEIYELVCRSLSDSKNDWNYRDHYHTTRRGVGIPYEITNDKLGITIWIANGWTFCNMTLKQKSEINGVIFLKEVKLPSIGIFRKIKLYRKSMSLFKGNILLWDMQIPKDYKRDKIIDDILK